MTDQQPMTYSGSGVNYGAMDPAKVNAQQIGRSTDQYAERFGYRVVEASIGESVFLLEAEDHILAFLLEGLGTKNLIADVMRHLLGRSFDDKYAWDAQAMILNDMITAGALPLVTGQYLAVGSDRWFANPERAGGVAIGTTEACHEARCVYGPGETPTLRDIIVPTAADLAGGAVGIIKPKQRYINPANLQEGDKIVFLAASGVHCNGLTMLRDLGDKIGYGSKLPDGRSFGEAVLEKTPLYVRPVEALLDAGIRVHYAVNITGHGWRKIMRHKTPFVYRINRVETDHVPIFDFIRRQGPVTMEEMFRQFNMGAGFALFVHPDDAHEALQIMLRVCGQRGWIGGTVEKDGDRKAVVIEPYDITLEGETLAVR